MPHSRRSIKRRKKIKNKPKTKEVLVIPYTVQRSIDIINDQNISLEERQALQHQLYGEDDKLKPQFYKRETRKIR